jgi:carbonic anhydrase
VLKVGHIVLCGHSGCGAMHGLLEPRAVAALPGVSRWLAFAQPVVAELERAGAGLSHADRLRLAIEQNVLAQLENLKTHPAVAAALAAGELKLHGWTYHFETGTVQSFDRASGSFVALTEKHPAAAGPAPAGGTAGQLPPTSI